eukprot:g38358.t1
MTPPILNGHKPPIPLFETVGTLRCPVCKSMSFKERRDVDSLLRPALPVPSDLRGQNLKLSLHGPPADAAEYLLRVRLEARALPDTMVASVPDTRPPVAAASGSYLDRFRVKEYDQKDRPVSAVLVPDPTWQNELGASFAETRQAVLRFKALHKRKPLPAPNNLPLPPLRDQVAWRLFCLGTPNRRPAPPLLSVVLTMDQVLIRRLLQEISSKVFHPYLVPPDDLSEEAPGREDENKPQDKSGDLKTHEHSADNNEPQDTSNAHTEAVDPTPAQAATIMSMPLTGWLFILLVVLDKPLNAEAASILRTLYRQIAAVRARQDFHSQSPKKSSDCASGASQDTQSHASGVGLASLYAQLPGELGPLQHEIVMRCNLILTVIDRGFQQAC